MARQMKESGIDWIGEIPSNWKVGKIKYCTTKIGSGKTPKGGSEVYAQTGVLFIRSQNVYDEGLKLDKPFFITPEMDSEMSSTRVAENDVLLNITGGSIGRSCIMPASHLPANVNQHVSIIRVRQGLVMPQIMHYFWMSNAGKTAIDLFQTGGNREGMSADAIANTPFLYYGMDEQKRIVYYLDKKCAQIDAVISKTNATIEEYKKLKQSIIAEAVTKGIQHNRQMKPSGIAWTQKIPGNWSVIPSKYVFRNSDERKHDGDVLLTSSQKYGIISQSEYMERENAKVVLANKGLEDWKHVEPYDFIISLRSFQGGLEMSETTGCITWHYIVLKPCREIYSNYYKWLFKSEVYIRALQRTCNFIRDGQDLRYSNFVQVPLVVPPIAEQKEIADYLDKKCAEIDTLISKKTALLGELENYKKSIIYEYVTGKKEVQ